MNRVIAVLAISAVLLMAGWAHGSVQFPGPPDCLAPKLAVGSWVSGGASLGGWGLSALSDNHSGSDRPFGAVALGMGPSGMDETTAFQPTSVPSFNPITDDPLAGQAEVNIPAAQRVEGPVSMPEPATIIVWSLLGGGAWLGMRMWRQRDGVGSRQPWLSENRQAIYDIISRGRMS